MTDVPDPNDLFIDPRRLLKEFGLVPKRSWGQNFLVSSKAVVEIARLCVDEPGRRVLEIGPGLGTLTHALLKLGADLVAVERDREMCDVLRAQYSDNPNFQLEEQDAAKYRYQDAFASTKGVIAGNLPYQITGQILRRVIDEPLPLVRAVFMVQKEVADRLVATEKDKARGALSVMVQLRMDVRRALRLKPTAFFPPPKVHSAIVVFEPVEDPAGDGDYLRGVDRLVKAAFSSRRKTLRNAVKSAGFATPDQFEAVLAISGIDGTRRAETLSNQEFLSLFDAFLAETGSVTRK